MVAAAVIGGSALLSAGTSLLGSSKTSSAAKDAANTQLSMYNTTRGDLSPYTSAGQSAMSSALSLAQGSPTGGGPDYVTKAYQNMPASSGAMTEAELQQTPGYQFTLSQGLKSTQAANAAKGLGVSGAALKGAATYATGLADSTYANRFNEAQQSFNDYLSLNTAQQGNLQSQFSRLNSLSTIGENAGAQTGAQGTSAASNYGNYLTQSAANSAAGLSGVSNAASSGINNYLAYQNYTGQTGGYGTSGSSGNSLDFSGYAPSLSSGQTYVGGFTAR